MKSLGISSLVISIISLFIPLFGVHTTFLSGILAAFSIGKGLVYGVIAIIINILNLIFLSPTLWHSIEMENNLQGSSSNMFFNLGFFGSVTVFIGSQLLFLIVLIIMNTYNKDKI